jgi:hypothetical protein
MEGNAMAFTGDVKNVIIPSPKNLPIIGGLFVGDLDVAAPDLDTDLSASLFTQLGFVSDDGIDDGEDRPTKSFFAWGGDLVAKPQESYDRTKTFTLWEFLNPDVAKVAYKEQNVTVTPATPTEGARLSILQTADVFDMQSWVVDAYGTGGKHILDYVPLGQITKKETMKTSHKEILAHKLTISIYPDTSGVYVYTYTDDGVLDAS